MSRPLTPLGLAVLYLLGKEPLHPYEMQQRIRSEAIDQAVKATHGALYHAVDRLAEKGLIEPLETSRDGRRPERTVYAITEQGRDEAFSQLREMMLRPVQEYPQLAAALTFATLLPVGEVAEMLAKRTVAVEAKIAAHDTVIDGLRKQEVERAGLIEIEYVQALMRAELDWLRGIVDDIRDGRLQW
jgi:DNA-binding PadR family transcriptional regulator